MSSSPLFSSSLIFFFSLNISISISAVGMASLGLSHMVQQG